MRGIGDAMATGVTTVISARIRQAETASNPSGVLDLFGNARTVSD